MNTCEHKKELEDSLIVEGDIYTHTKSGKGYIVIDAGTFRDANTGEYLIGYQEVDDPSAQIWMHTVANFMAVNDDESPRFELLQAGADPDV